MQDKDRQQLCGSGGGSNSCCMAFYLAGCRGEIVVLLLSMPVSEMQPPRMEDNLLNTVVKQEIAADCPAAVAADGLSHGVLLLNSNGMDVILNPSSLTYKCVLCDRGCINCIYGAW